MNYLKIKEFSKQLNKKIFQQAPSRFSLIWKTLTTILFLSGFFQPNAQEISFYDLKIKIDVPSKTVFVDGFINADFKNKDTLSLVLWKYSSIKEINNNDKNIKFYFDTLTASPIMYITNGRKLLVVKSDNNSSKQSIYFNYSSDFSKLSRWANSFAENWIELNFYCAWFPVNLGYSSFNSKFLVYINDGFNITGSGIVSKKKDCWEMKQT